MPDRFKGTRVQAEAAFRKAQKAARDQEKSDAMKEYEARAEATQAKSERLKALRLAKEAADAEAAATAASRKKMKKKPGR